MTKEQSFSADSASVQERQVTVRVLTIGTKQVTQTMYKQLVDKCILDDHVHLRGFVWGWVNVHDNDCTKDTHLHVIWDDGKELKRCKMYNRATMHDPGFNRLYSQIKTIRLAYICAMVLENKLLLTDMASTSDGERSVYIEGERQSVPYSVVNLLIARKNHWPIDTPQEEANNTLDMYLRHAQLSPTVRSSSDLKEKMIEAQSDLVSYKLAYSEIYSEIENSGQLFIAVSGVWK